MDSCPDVDALERFVAGELEAEAHRSVDTHVASCGQCHDRVTEVRDNLRAVGSIRRAMARPDAAPETAALPERIGPYRIIRELGRGGMGSVYEAEQDRPRRVVALKVIKAGCVTTESLRRFEHESQVLGRLQHPGIAQIFEAAMADTGQGPQPYFAMEFIRGQSLREHADSQGLGTLERLELMAKVCDAVQHAHQKGVIHRDLKPSNILVDESGRPKILDFGVARATDSDVQATTLQTDVGQLLGTVPYMSPEQVSGDPHELDTRSDVYSLGVVTYELLTGKLPYDLTRRMLPDAVRVIREQDAAPLSSVDRVYRGDVETVVAKALEKDKARRYQSAADMAGDIRRYLRDEPIVARPPSAMYQLRKFARRNRALVGGAAAVFVVLTGGAAVSTWQALRAIRAEAEARRRLVQARQAQAHAEAKEAEAQKEADKFKAVNEFVQDMLASASPEVAPGRSDATIREVLAQAAEELDSGSLSDQPEIELAVRTTIGNTYRALGQYSAAEPHLRQAVEIGRRLRPEGHEDLAYAMNKLARLLNESGEYDEAEDLFRETLVLRRRLHGEEHSEVAKIMSNLAVVLADAGKLTEAEALHRESLAMRRRCLGEDHTDVATGLNNLALVLCELADYEGAEPLLRESLELDRRLRDGDHPNLATTMDNLATVLTVRGQYEEAESLQRESLAMRRRLLGAEHPHIASGLTNLGRLLSHRGRYDDAEAMLREALAMNRRLRGGRHPDVAGTLESLGLLAQARGEAAMAEPFFREASDIRREVLGEGHPLTTRALYNLAGVYLVAGRHDEAEPLLAAAVAGAKSEGSGLPAGHWYTGMFLTRYGKCLTAMERYPEAEEALLDAHGVLESARGPADEKTIEAIEALTELYDAWGRLQQASKWRTKLPESISNNS